MTPYSTGYSWTDTAQWSQIPAVPTYQSNNVNIPQINRTIPQQTSYSQTPQESRKEMITRLYRTILGREPDVAGLNYYLYNTQIPEHQIAREMFESTEHADILEKVKDIRNILRASEESIRKVAELERSLENLKAINENYKILLEQKNQIINQLRQQYHIAEVENINVTPQSQNQQNQQDQNQQIQQNQQNQESLEYILADPFEEEHASKKGFISWIKSWFRF